MTPGSTIAHYRITGKLGEGGMGAVYRATDTKLNRDVAIKVLPEDYAQDADRMARFSREAQVLAGLNHPNIAAIYGLEERSLILELVPGPDLAERMTSGPLTLEEALPIARQLAEALEYAHERGIIHRDLKPANLKVTPEGKLKVLDFGLAKALASEAGASASASPMSSPTMTMRATMAGVIMGTAGYMSPEQAKGKPVDRRADIWAFGVVFVEMLTGQMMYTGETVSETLASVIKDQPALDKLPADTPPHIRRLLRRCLEKDPQRRLQAIGEVRIAIDEAPAEESPAPAAVPAPASAPVRWKLATAICALLGAGALGIAWRATHPVERPLQRFSADLGPEAVRGLQTTAILSPDGTRLVFQAHNAGGTQMLATRLLDQSKSNLMTGTEGAVNPFFSPDGQWVGFFADQKMKKISVQGGAAIALCDSRLAARGAAWGEDGSIIANLDNLHLWRVPAAGGKPELLAAKPEDHRERTWRWPQFLPGGEHLLFTAGRGESVGNYEDANIDVLNLKTGQLKIVQRGGYYGRYLPSGHLVFVREGTLFSVPFDTGRLEARGVPVPVLDDVAGAVGQGAGQFDFSTNGILVYLAGKAGSQSASRLVWMDQTGKQQALLTLPGDVGSFRLSPDGKRLALSATQDIAVYDLERDTSTKLTFSGASNRSPLWMPDGKHLVFSQGLLNGESRIWWVRVDGSGQPEKLFASNDDMRATSLSPDGRRVLFQRMGTASGADLWTLPLDLSDPDHPKPGKPEVFLSEPADQSDGAFSPDGRWVAYMAADSTQAQVFVRPFPGGPSAGKWQISSAPARFPVWSHSGRELFFLSLVDSHLMVAGVAAQGETFSPERVRDWSPSSIIRSGNFRTFDLAPDGKRIVTFPTVETESVNDKSNVHITVLLNFFEELKRRVPAAK